MLEINNLKVQVEQEQILQGVNLEVDTSEIHAIMGPNGSGKSTLAKSLMGHPAYEINQGSIVIDGEGVTKDDPNERAQKGLFLSLQYPPEIGGVNITNFLKTATQSITGEDLNPVEFHNELKEKMKDLGIDTDFADRNVNEGFSGGEKKKSEILQLTVLDPKYAILDETDSGLDVDALRIVADGINNYHSDDNGIVLITHYQRILDFVEPDFVHVMKQGKIVESGDKNLAKQVENQGYEQF